MSINLFQSARGFSTFSFQDALSTYKGHMAPYFTGTLFKAGCQDCATACKDPALVFGNPYTLQNCMVLASLAPVQSNANGSLTLRNRTLSTELVTTATDFSINLTDPRFPSSANSVNKMISGCLQQYCNTDSQCDSNYTMCEWYFQHEAYENNTTGGYCYRNICNETGKASFNPDIGGIGVLQP